MYEREREGEGEGEGEGERERERESRSLGTSLPVLWTDPKISTLNCIFNIHDA